MILFKKKKTYVEYQDRFTKVKFVPDKRMPNKPKFSLMIVNRKKPMAAFSAVINKHLHNYYVKLHIKEWLSLRNFVGRKAPRCGTLSKFIESGHKVYREVRLPFGYCLLVRVSTFTRNKLAGYLSVLADWYFKELETERLKRKVEEKYGGRKKGSSGKKGKHRNSTTRRTAGKRANGNARPNLV